MEVKDTNKIYKEIEAFVIQNGGNYQDYYIGITRDLERRIDEDAINEHISSGLYDPQTPRYEAKAKSRDVAAAIETAFHDKGMKRPGGKGKEDSQYIYTFKIKTPLNDGALVTTSDSIRAMIIEGRKRERLRWLSSFRKFFNFSAGSSF